MDNFGLGYFLQNKFHIVSCQQGRRRFVLPPSNGLDQDLKWMPLLGLLLGQYLLASSPLLWDTTGQRHHLSLYHPSSPLSLCSAPSSDVSQEGRRTRQSETSFESKYTRLSAAQFSFYSFIFLIFFPSFSDRYGTFGGSGEIDPLCSLFGVVRVLRVFFYLSYASRLIVVRSHVKCVVALLVVRLESVCIVAISHDS